MAAERVKWQLGRSVLFLTFCLVYELSLTAQLLQAAQIGKEYEARGGDYENEPGSKNKPKKGPPEKKSESTKSKETHDGQASDNSSQFYRNANRSPDWDGGKGDANATETDSEESEYAMGDKEDKIKKDEAGKNNAKKGIGRLKKGIARPVKKNARGDKETEKKDAGNDKGKEMKDQKASNGTKQRTSPRVGQRSSTRQAEAASAKGAGEKRKSSGGEDKGFAKKTKK
jgi:hypothetical protein